MNGTTYKRSYADKAYMAPRRRRRARAISRAKGEAIDALVAAAMAIAAILLAVGGGALSIWLANTIGGGA